VAVGFFNSVFEQKEYAESYVMEKLAREMMEKDSEAEGGVRAKVRPNGSSPPIRRRA
jgi:hypothetical protein